MAEYGLLDAERSILVVIDEQERLMDLIYRPQLVIDATKRLMQLAELFSVPTVLTEQYPKGLGGTISAIQESYDALESPKRYVEKTAFGCCGDDAFMAALGELRPDVPLSGLQVVVCGIETHVCVMQTVLELLRHGASVHVCWDATSGRGEEYRMHAFERMQQAGAVLTNNESVGFEWCRDKNHPQFKAMNGILRAGQLGG